MFNEQNMVHWTTVVRRAETQTGLQQTTGAKQKLKEFINTSTY